MRATPQPIRFAIIGAAATVTHLAVGLGTIATGVPPLAANPVAFAVAFGVSFVGHRAWTFANTGVPVRQALPRFAAVALGGLALNEAALAALLNWGIAPTTAFALAVALAAVSTYVLSRAWAFRPRGRSTCQR